MMGRHRFVFLLAYPVALLSLLYTLGHFYLNSSYFRSGMQVELAKALPGNVSWSQMVFGPLPGQFAIHRLQLLHPDGDELLFVTRLSGRLVTDVTELALRRVQLRDVEVERVRCRVDVDASGHLKWLDVLKESPEDKGPAKKWQATVSSLSVSGVDVKFKHPKLHGSITGLALAGGYIGLHDIMELRGELSASSAVLIRPRPGREPLRYATSGVELAGLEWVGQTLQVRALKLVTEGGLFEASLESRFEGEPTLKLLARSSGHFDMPLLTQFYAPWYKMTGAFELNGHLDGPLMHPTGHFTATSAELRMMGLPWRKVSTGIRVDGQVFHFEDARADLLDGEVTFAGPLDVLSADLDGTGTVTGLRLTPLLKKGAKPSPWLNGRIDGSYSTRGISYPTPAIRLVNGFDLRMRRSGRLPGFRVPSTLRLRGEVFYDVLSADLRQLELSAGGHRLAMTGQLDLKAKQLKTRLEISSADLATVLVSPKLVALQPGGKLGFSGTLEGAWLNPSLDGVLSLAGGRLAGRYRSRHCSVGLRLSDGVLTLDNLQLHSNVGSLQANGTMTLWDESVSALRPDPSFDLAGVVRRVSLAGLAAGRVPVEGQLDVEFQLQGSVAKPSGSANLVSGALRAYGQRLNYVSMDMGLQPDGVSLNRLRLQLDSERHLLGKGRFGFDKRFNAHLTGHRLPLRALGGVAGEKLDLQGELTLDLSLSGTPQAPQLSGLVGVKALQIDGRELGDANLSLITEDGVVQARGERLFGQFALASSLPLDGAPPSVVLTFQDLALDRFAPELRELGIGGQVSGSLNATRSITGLPLLGARLDRLNVGYRELEISNQVPGQAPRPLVFGFDGERLKIERVMLVERGRAIQIGGSVGRDGDLALTLRGEADLGAATLMTEVVSAASGAVHLDVSAKGPAKKPQITGLVRVAEEIQVAARALPGRDLVLESGEIRLRGDGVSIEADAPLRGRLDDGTFSLTAEARMRDGRLQGYDLRVRGRQIDWKDSRMSIQVLADGDLSFEAKRLERADREMTLSGRVDLVEGLYNKSFAPVDVRQIVSPEQEYRGAGLDPGSMLASVRFEELQIVGRDSFLVKSRVPPITLDLELAPQLNLEGTVGAPRPQGTVQTLEGSEIVFSKRSFEVVRGTIQFDQHGEAVLDLYAEAEITPRAPNQSTRTLDTSVSEERAPEHVALAIKGPLSNPDVKFESRSGLRESDVVLLIASGYLAEDLAASSGQGGTDALDLVLTPLLSDIERQLAQRTSLVDRLELVPNVAARAVDVRASAQALQGHLAADVTTTVGADSGAKVNLEIKITDHMSVDFETDTQDLNSPGEGKVRYRLPLD